MVDIASITVAVISLVGSVVVAVAGGLWAFYNDERKARRETDKLLRKYRDPLLLAAHDLQARLYNITELSIITDFMPRKDEKYQDSLFIYTAYLFGQFLCWTHILRRQTQFLCFTTDEPKSTKNVTRLIDTIKSVLNTDKYQDEGNAFLLWKGHQTAIGELMCVSEANELMCMGFSTFTRKWKEAEAAMHPSPPREDQFKDQNEKASSSVVSDQSVSLNESVVFRKWFDSIEHGIHTLYAARQHGGGSSDNRLRRLQHCLVDLVDALDPNDLRSDAESDRVRGAPFCPCLDCQKNFPRSARGTGGGAVLGAKRGEMA